jgi:hypothetical protein
MPFIRKHAPLALVAAGLAAGAGASVVATAGASGSKTSHARNHHALRAPAGRRLARRAVEGSFVVKTPRHGFVRVRFWRGRVDGVSGQQLTLTEGTRTASYKQVTLSIPATARVRDNGHQSALSDLSAGQRVVVIKALGRTRVRARTG